MATQHVALPRRVAVAAALFFALAAPVVGQTRFVISPSGTEVTDTLTNLVWMRCSEGQAWTGKTCSGKALSVTWEGALARAPLAGPVWRLPNVKELVTLVDLTRMNPCIDPVAFPGTLVSRYWASNATADFSDFAWTVGFDFGGVAFWHMDIGFRVRLVRDAP